MTRKRIDLADETIGPTSFPLPLGHMTPKRRHVFSPLVILLLRVPLSLDVLQIRFFSSYIYTFPFLKQPT